MSPLTIALFGEAERGEYGLPHYLRSVAELADRLGNPPQDSYGMPFAIRSLLFDQHILFFRVEEEGYSLEDYLIGFDALRAQPNPQPAALCLPGVGDDEIIDASCRICSVHQALLLFTEADLYDYLTNRPD